MAGEIRVDLTEVRFKLPSFLKSVAEKQVPFATALALTRAAAAAKRKAIGAMPRHFDRPTPYSLRSVFMKAATKKNLVATVWLNDSPGAKGTPAEKFMVPNIYGVQRSQKRSERALEQRGILPRGFYAVPGERARLDEWGNQTRAEIVQLLSALKAFSEQGFSANRSLASAKRNKKLRTFFVQKTDSFYGVLERVGNGRRVRPVLFFTQKLPKYQKIFPFIETVRDGFEDRFMKEFQPALEEAIATAGKKSQNKKAFNPDPRAV